MKKILKKLFIFIVTVNFLGIILECTIVRGDSETIITNASIAKDRLQTIKEKGVITVASPLSDIAYFYIDNNTNKIAGIEADIITEIAKRLGIDKIESKNVQFSNLLEKLNIDDSIDISAGGIFITPEREKVVGFTEPLYKASDSIVVPMFSNINFKDDLKNGVVGVEKGTVYMDLAEQWKKDNLIKDVVIFENTPELLNAINSNMIHAGLVDSIIIKYSLINEKNLNLRTLKGYTPEITGSVGIAVRKNDSTLLNALNEKISEMKADGTLYAILRENGLDKDNMA
ncbi:amino acid ABC transporter substrate-binding protein [Clostridium beijerinckii]|nr:amino acid ABC transporter substrate-binding protein [Clostridium beijerinckii]